MKKYILRHFHYLELGENFTRKMRKVAKELAYLFFFVVDNSAKVVTVLRVMRDGMDWKDVFKRWLKRNK